MTFHTFGDSHANFGWKCIPTVKIHHINSSLCYSFGRDKFKRLNIKDIQYKVKNNDYVCFCFGEIDCRNHVNKHITKEQTYEIIINNIINLYFYAIKLNVDQFDNLNVCVYNIVPPTKGYHVDGNPYPFLGTDDERKQYTLYFNKQLCSKCKEFNYTYFNVYDFYTDSDGFLSDQYSDGVLHIKNGIHINQVLNELMKKIIN
jgi:hypothetical protein